MLNEKLDVTDIEARYCYVCGANVKSEGCSLHYWNTVYECGCEVCGPISEIGGIYLSEPCKKDTK